MRFAIRAPKGSTDGKYALAGGGFVDAVPKARPEYSEGNAHIYLLFRVSGFGFWDLGFGFWLREWLVVEICVYFPVETISFKKFYYLCQCFD